MTKQKFFEQIFYTYIYLDPRKSNLHIYGDYSFNYEPFYAGKGSGNRCNNHLYCNGNNPYLNRKIRKILSLGYEIPIVKVQENLIECNAFRLEIDLIKTIGRKDLGTGPLLNLTDGGESPSGYIHTKETKEKMKIAWKNRPPVTDETKEKISNSLIGNQYGVGHIVSDIAKEKLRQANTGRKQSEDAIEKSRKKRTGVKRTPEQCLNISNGVKNIMTDEHKKILSLAQLGRKTKPESIENNRQAQLKRWELYRLNNK